MAEPSENVDLVLLALEVDLGGRTRAKHLDRDVPAQELVVGAIHVRHAAARDHVAEAISVLECALCA